MSLPLLAVLAYTLARNQHCWPNHILLDLMYTALVTDLTSGN